MRIWPGQPQPLGATWDGEGVNFALFSENAESVHLCLYDHGDEAKESHRIQLTERTNFVWHAYLPDVRPGQLYGYRVRGPYAPERGHRFNPAKLLLDPYASAISGPLAWNDAFRGELPGHGAPDPVDSAAAMPKCVVVDSAFTWGDDRPPRIPWNRTLIYECHVRGLTMRHPDVPAPLRGSYLGLASDPIVDHLQKLGVTAVELLPIHAVITEKVLVERGLTNYWGYNSACFFAPDGRFASGWLGQQVSEFKSMVKTLHRAGIEVILDVVYNHTGEGNHLGPTISLRGIDNASYYRLDPKKRREYVDFTGCGNTLNMLHPRVMQLVMDSLRYWVTEMHVDGFRFDLAPALARELHEVDRLGRFFAMIQQDPALSRVKLIAEPWDLGEGGYQVGNFPEGWAEWNGKFRDNVRAFWRGDDGQVGELGFRLAGSSDLYAARGRHTFASINYVTCHDGFTLHDLVSYERKHNERNGHDNRDGTDHNLSRNWGVEGPTDQHEIVQLREQLKRAFLATVAFTQGVPMIQAGDELGRTQHGNNNAYCHDDESNWVDWSLDEARRALLDFAVRVFALRRENPVLRRRSFFRGQPMHAAGPKDLSWLRQDGHELSDADWRDPKRHVVGMLIDGQATDEVDERGRRITGDTLLLILNAGARGVNFRLPTAAQGAWREVLSTARSGSRIIKTEGLNVAAHSLSLLKLEALP
ncbi:MAG: glycogen debranching protein GlgX [Phycisphaerae bacterium]|nr:glycogen debranching protein GlgX [Phycisphaerae bacterium]